MLLAAILSMIIGSPFLDDLFHYAVIPDIFITIIFVSGIYAISRKKLHIYIALVLAIPMFIGVWSAYIFQAYKLVVLGHFFGALFIGFVISLLINFIFYEKEITKEVIFAAVVVYLLMAIMLSNAYLILEFFNPGSFSLPEGPSRNTFQYLYFSFVTITTLGYGDISPVLPIARFLVFMEAVIGVFYMAILVASLIGVSLSDRDAAHK